MDPSAEPDAVVHPGKRNESKINLGWVTGEPEFLDA